MGGGHCTVLLPGRKNIRLHALSLSDKLLYTHVPLDSSREAASLHCPMLHLHQIILRGPAVQAWKAGRKQWKAIGAFSHRKPTTVG